ncbi:cysteine-rich receptor-like protein kinase 10 isoform X2 [Humulus lupulus]|uniref:cysteine-rich receptor-like protein kinase 10 isoform X2 n=1 Tax=Humulus lupulus TaxID=3486 RepID=UPI002B4064FC|nr:cysteine-rich receptor-like protein kinase 10 isoform X2 [Humulus lupulus]
MLKSIKIPDALLFLFSLLFVSIGLSVGAIIPTYRYHTCPNTTTYAPNSIYQINLRNLLSFLSSNVSSEFHNTTFGEGSSSPVYGSFLCRGDVNATVCRDCVTFAVNDVVKRCPVEKETMIWYDECQLRYSNQSFFGTVSFRPGVYLWNLDNATNPNQFNLLTNTATRGAAAVAAKGMPGDKKFATKEDRVDGFQRLYTLVQCTPDLNASSCSTCLNEAIGLLPECCSGKIGGRVLFPSCNFRYEVYPFYNQIASTPPPAAAPVLPPPPPIFTPRSTGKRKISARTIVAIVVPIAVALLLFILGFFFLTKRTKKKYMMAKGGDDITTPESLQFDLATIEAATNKFSADYKLGEGGFGEVYKGTLPNGQEIAVKRLSKDSGQGTQEFKNEVVVLAKLQHRNLVRLLGFCLEREEKLLVYEFVPNKSLDYFLFDTERQGELTWAIRYKIIGGIARGILYLHEDSQRRIIHRDLKASNILLDADMNSKISDFGMARMFDVDQTRENTNRIVGTYGYMPPEYAMHGQFSLKSDVYSFGVLILEIICGKKNSNFYQSDYAEDLLSYAWKLWKDGNPLKLLDPTLKDSYLENEVVRCINIGLLCVQEDPEDRPTMKTLALVFNSDSVSLAVPKQPAFYNRSDADMKSMGLKFDESRSAEHPYSINEASISEFYPR